MMRRLGQLALALVAALACGCFEYSPYQVSSERDLNSRAFGRIVAEAPVEPLRFAVIGDTQRHLDETADAVHSLNRQEGLAFVVQVGDYTDFGTLEEYRAAEEILDRLSVPHVVVIGIHDFLGNGELIYTEMYGPLNDAFIVARTKLVLIDTNSVEVGRDGTVPDLAWLATELAAGPDFDRAVVFSHIAPDNSDFDQALAAPFASILSSGRVVLSVHGHEHQFRVGELFGDGVLYVTADSMEHRNYLIFTAQADGSFAVEQVAF